MWGVSAAVTSAILVTLSAAAAGTAVWSGDDGRSAAPRIAHVMLVAGLVGPAAIGLVAVFRFTGVLIVVILAGTTPALTALVRARWFAPGDRPTQQEESAPDRVPAPRGRPAVSRPAVEPMPELSSLDDEALCLAWRRSFLQLEGARSAAERLAVVDSGSSTSTNYTGDLRRDSRPGSPPAHGHPATRFPLSVIPGAEPAESGTQMHAATPPATPVLNAEVRCSAFPWSLSLVQG
jgi:hypothetical protein